MVTRTCITKECSIYGRKVPLSKDRWYKNKSSSNRRGEKKARTCFKYDRRGHISKGCKAKDAEHREDMDSTPTAIVMFRSVVTTMMSMQKSHKWILHLAVRSTSLTSMLISTCLRAWGLGPSWEQPHNFVPKIWDYEIKSAEHVVRFFNILSDSMYTPDISLNLISLSRMRRKHFKVPNDLVEGETDLRPIWTLHKPWGQLQMLGEEASDGPYRAVIKVKTPDQARQTRTEPRNLWYERLDQFLCKVLQSSLSYFRVFKGKIKRTGECHPCALCTAVRTPQNGASFEDKTAVIPLSCVYSDVVGNDETPLALQGAAFVTLVDSYSV